MKRVTLDTNILLYRESLRSVDADDRKIALSGDLLDRLFVDGWQVWLAAQVLCEFHNALRRKLRLPASEAMRRVELLTAFCQIQSTTQDVLISAWDLANRYNLQTYDAVILAAGAQAGCEILYSEDMQHGFEWSGVTIINPFA